MECHLNAILQIVTVKPLHASLSSLYVPLGSRQNLAGLGDNLGCITKGGKRLEAVQEAAKWTWDAYRSAASSTSSFWLAELFKP